MSAASPVDAAAGGFPASPEPYGYRPDAATFGMPEANGGVEEEDLFWSGRDDGVPVLPPPGEMAREEGFLLREWRRKNAILLEEKEKNEKELQSQIVLEAEEFRKAFFEKRNLNIETGKGQNREREKLFLSNQEKFHAKSDKQYWKSISELIPHEIANIKKRGSQKEKEKEREKPGIVAIQGPKPGKPTDLSRMRQILLKLKHAPPRHMEPAAPGKDAAAIGTVPAGAAAAVAEPIAAA